MVFFHNAPADCYTPQFLLKSGEQRMNTVDTQQLEMQKNCKPFFFFKMKTVGKAMKSTVFRR